MRWFHQRAVPFRDIVKGEHCRARGGKGKASVGGAQEDVNPFLVEKARQHPLLADNLPFAIEPHDPNRCLVCQFTVAEPCDIESGASCQCFGYLMGVTGKPTEMRVSQRSQVDPNGQRRVIPQAGAMRTFWRLHRYRERI
jgi:hypothetical protein